MASTRSWRICASSIPSTPLKRSSASATPCCGCGAHEIPATITDQGRRQVVEPGSYQLEQAVIGRQHLHVGIVGQQVMAAVLTGADGGHALEVAVPVEHPAAENAFDFPARGIRKRFG